MQHRAFDSPGGFLVGAIVLDVNRCRGSIFLADAMNAGWIAVSRDIIIENLGTEGTVPEGVIERGLRRTEQIALRERRCLRQQDPWPVGLRETRVGPAPRFENRNHIEDCKTLDLLGMVQSQAIGDASPAIMTD